MSQSSVAKTVSGGTTKITTSTSKTVTSFSQQQQIQQQQIRQQQPQTKQKVTNKPPHRTENRTENLITKNSSQQAQQNQLEAKIPQMKPQQTPTEDVCVRCNRIVYKMEEVIAEHQIWHRGCFRCNECDKPLNRHSKVESFQIHEGVVYCKIHFKQLFGPKDAPKRKPELVIRENQPAELPEGVVRSSDQYHLGLEDIQTAAVKTRFQMFEKIATTKEEPEALQHNLGLKRSPTVLSKMKKFRAKGLDVGVIDLKTNGKKLENPADDDDDDSIHSEDYDDGVDVDLIRAKRAQREQPLKIDNMNEIKTKFEAGIDRGREARHEERKQEIQNIRTRLFWGKQARTKELYQNAVADLEANSKLRNKGFSTASEMENVKAAADKQQKIKQKFETGDIYRQNSYPDNEFDDRLDQRTKTSTISNKVSERMQILAKQQAQDQLIKSHAKTKIAEKADISNQYEFFENYDPEEQKGKDVRATPARTTDKQKNSVQREDDDDEAQSNPIKIDDFAIEGLKIDGVVEKAKNTYIDSVRKSKTMNKKHGIDKAVVQQNQTASKITSGRKVGIAQNQPISTEPKPSPEEMQHLNDDTGSEAESEISSRKPGYLDRDLEQARLAARTRDLKVLFEKWNYENNVYDTAAYNDSIPEFDDIDDSQTETTKTIRAKFEKLPYSGQIQNAKQPKMVNRFVD